MRPKTAKISMVLFCFTVAAFVSGIPAGSASAADYAIYHGITKVTKDVISDKTYVQWTKDNFGVSGGDHPTLSFMHFDNDAAATAAAQTDAGTSPGISQSECLIKVNFTEPKNTPQEKDFRDIKGVGTIAIDATPPVNAAPFPWHVYFDNDPAGHWSLKKEYLVIGLASNAAAGRIAAAGFEYLTFAGYGQITVINGKAANCQAGKDTQL